MVARYLAHLFVQEGLAPKTIQVHKSAIVTFCGPAQNASKISSDFLVRHVLKAISMARGIREKAPIWDPRQVVDWLIKNPPAEDSLFEASRRAAILLVLASGRRVHDLTLLRITPEHFIDKRNAITLWPIFGAKTDSAKHKQSGWKLTGSEKDNINPLKWLRKVVALSTGRRGPLLKNLFVTTSGEAKPATQTIIGGWIKSVLREAGIHATPGSVRSAVASLNWLEDYPIEEILTRGNWKSEHTFRKFYRREIALPRSEHLQRSMAPFFTPV